MKQQEIEHRLNHLRNIISIRTRNLEELELQEANYGIDVPIHIINHIKRLANQIENHKKEVDQLETISVEGDMTLSEVEYRMVLAEAWSTHKGRPTVVGKTKIEYTRLKLHITVDRAKELEQEIRGELASEIYRNMQPTYRDEECLEFTIWLSGEKSVTWEELVKTELIQDICRIVALDIDLALFILIEDIILAIGYPLHLKRVCQLFGKHRSQDEYAAVAHRINQVPMFSHEKIRADLYMFGPYVL